MFRDELFDILYIQDLYLKNCFTLLRENFGASFKFCTLPNNAEPLFVTLVFNSCSSAGVILPFFCFPLFGRCRI